jgi:two-component system LytT family sensor kinase
MQQMSNGNQIEISDVIDIAILQQIQDTFARAMGIATVTVDRTGRPVTRDTNFQPFCKLRRSTPQGLASCQASDAEGGRVAHALGCPHSYTCGGGLMDSAAPITIEGEYVGCILCGQVLPADDRERFIADIIERNVAMGLPREEVSEMARKLPVVPRKRFQAATELLSLVANYIIQMGAARMAQEKLLKEAQQNAALQTALQEAQLRALKAQINPHFLFNSLTLIAYTAIEEQAPRTEEITYILSDILRYSLRSMSSSVELREEMEMIEHYLAIQQVRFGDRLHWQVDIDPTIHTARIPCMVVQPLVENAVLHAAEPVTRPVTITVRGWRENGRVNLTIADDGAGIEPGLVAAINKGELPQGGDKPPLGLRNIIQRLEGEYGQDLQINVESLLDMGTVICISFPYYGEEKDFIMATTSTETV